MNRPHEEYMFYAITLMGITGITPFIGLRVMDGQWLVAMIDAVMAIFAALAALYVWKTRKVRIPSLILTLFYLSGLIAVTHIRGPDMVYWAFPGMTAAFFLVKPIEAATINFIVLLAIIPVLNANLAHVEMISIIVTLILNSLFSYIFIKGVHGQQTELTLAASRDSLTGAGNRGLFDEDLKQALSEFEREEKPYSLIILDIDHFKKVNDTFGHSKGDEVLVELIAVLKERLRKSDGLYRLGGEEFAILLKETDIDTAFSIADDLRQRVTDCVQVIDQAITISLGVAELKSGEDGKTWLQRADMALYEAKDNGRNNTCVNHEHRQAGKPVESDS